MILRNVKLIHLPNVDVGVCLSSVSVIFVSDDAILARLLHKTTAASHYSSFTYHFEKNKQRQYNYIFFTVE